MKMLFSAYRLDQYPDPDGFMAQAAVVLSSYSEETVLYVTDPRTGYQRRNKWPPNIPELWTACDEAKAFLAAESKMALKGYHWDGERYVQSA